MLSQVYKQSYSEILLHLQVRFSKRLHLVRENYQTSFLTIYGTQYIQVGPT